MDEPDLIKIPIAFCLAFVGVYMGFVAWGHLEKPGPTSTIYFHIAVVLVGASAGSLWRRPILGVCLGIVSGLVMFWLAALSYFLTHGIPMLG